MHFSLDNPVLRDLSPQLYSEVMYRTYATATSTARQHEPPSTPWRSWPRALPLRFAPQPHCRDGLRRYEKYLRSSPYFREEPPDLLIALSMWCAAPVCE